MQLLLFFGKDDEEVELSLVFVFGPWFCSLVIASEDEIVTV